MDIQEANQTIADKDDELQSKDVEIARLKQLLDYYDTVFDDYLKR